MSLALHYWMRGTHYCSDVYTSLCTHHIITIWWHHHVTSWCHHDHDDITMSSCDIITSHHCSDVLRFRVSEMTYTVSSGTLNSTIPYHTIWTFIHVPLTIHGWSWFRIWVWRVSALSFRRDWIGSTSMALLRINNSNSYPVVVKKRSRIWGTDNVYYYYYYYYYVRTIFSFSAMTLLVGRQEGLPVCKTWVLTCWWRRFDWSRARLIAPVVTTSTILIPSKSRMETFWYWLVANQGHGKWPLNGESDVRPIIQHMQFKYPKGRWLIGV